MLKQLYADYVLQSFDDQDFKKLEGKFASLNLERIYRFSIIIAIACLLLSILPNLVFYFSPDEKQTENSRSFLFLQLSLLVFMLLFYAASQYAAAENNLKNKISLTKLFVSVILLHAFGLSVVSYSQVSGVSVFLLTSCALMVGLYWPSKRILLFIGSANILYLAALYMIYESSAVFHTHLTSHLLFNSIFFILSRSVLDLKIRDIKNFEKIENQSNELKNSHVKLRMTEHTLSAINQNVHQGIFRLEKNKGFTYANDYLANLLGYSTATELITDKSAKFLSSRHLEDISRKVNEQGFLQGIEVEIKRNDNTRFWAQISCSVRRDGNTGVLIYEGSATDISHKKKALQEALENAAKLEQAEKIANAGFYEINVANGQISYSAGLCEILNIEQSGPLSLQKHLEFIHPDDHHMVRNTILEAITRNKEFFLEYRVLDSKGEIKYLNSKAGLIRDEQGNKVKILGTVQDVTIICLSRKALARSEAYIKAAFNNKRYGILIMDLQHKIVDFNEECAEKISAWREMSLEKGMDLYHLMEPETKSTIAPIISDALQGRSALTECKFMEGTPHEMWVELYVSPVKDPEDKVTGVLLMGSNISERKYNEALFTNLSLVASNTDNAVMISDRKHRVEWVNEAFERNMGFSLNEIIAQFPKDFLVCRNTDTITLNNLNSALRDGKSFTDEILICDKAGRERWMHLVVNPVFENNGRHVKFVSVYTDLSKIKAYEQELRLAKEKAEHSAKSKESFLSTVSHELRTPLNAVVGLTHHMLQNEPREDQLEDLNILRFSAENLLNLINDILDLSKIEAGKVKIEKVVFNFKDIINSLKQSFQNQAEAKGLDFKVILNDHVPEALVGDSVRLIQILANLLSNAVKFTSEGAVHMYINADQKETGLCELQISVEDTGLGIAEDKLELIFDKFEQAGQNSHQKFGGTGLGLAITKQLVELQEGQIKVRSTYGAGTCFTVMLSYQMARQEDLEPLVRSSGAFPDADVSRLRILMVEDNKINQAVAGKFMKSWNIPFDVAQNGEEAVQKAGETKYDLILMDLQMPVMDGYEATRCIRLLKEPDYTDIPIIAITAAGNSGIEQNILAAGMTDMVFKPFKPDDLLIKIRQHCSFKKALHTPTSMNQTAEATPPPTETVPDLSGILKIAGEDQTFLKELIKLYIEQFTIMREETIQGLEEEDPLVLRRIFHKIKPSIAMLKQERMQELGRELHGLLNNEIPDFGQISPLTYTYLEEMENLKEFLRKELENNNFVLG